MPITKNSGRQGPIDGFVTVNFGDVVSGVAQAAIKMKANCVLTDGALITDTAFNSATSDTLAVGDALVANRYLAATSIHATGITPLVPTGYVSVIGANAAASSDQIMVTWTGVGAAPSAGSVRLRVRYIDQNRQEFSQN